MIAKIRIYFIIQKENPLILTSIDSTIMETICLAFFFFLYYLCREKKIKNMEATEKKKTRKRKVVGGTNAEKEVKNSLKKRKKRGLLGIFKGKIHYDDSIFNLA